MSNANLNKAAVSAYSRKPFGYRLVTEFKRDWQLHLLMLVPVLYIIIFAYVPMYGVQIAFKDYRIAAGIFGSEWVGMKWFVKFLTGFDCFMIIKNTLVISLYSMIAGFPLPILFALVGNALPCKRYVKFTQIISYLPHFLSTVILVSIVNMVLNPMTGLYGNLYRLLGGIGYPVDVRSTAASFRHVYVWSGVWQGLGWGSIIYTAALTNVSLELHDAAIIDGATRWQRIWTIDFPCILPTAAMLLILNFGSIMSVGFEKVFLLQTDLNMSTSEVIQTYIYNKTMNDPRDFSFGSAIGLFQSAVSCILMMLVNGITKKLSDGEIAMF